MVGEGEQMDSFPRALAQREMQIASPWIWTQIADSISTDDTYYAKHFSCINIYKEYT